MRKQERQRGPRNEFEIRRFPAFEVRRKLDKGERRRDRIERRRKAILSAGRQTRDSQQVRVILLAEQSWMQILVWCCWTERRHPCGDVTDRNVLKRQADRSCHPCKGRKSMQPHLALSCAESQQISSPMAKYIEIMIVYTLYKLCSLAALSRASLALRLSFLRSVAQTC